MKVETVAEQLFFTTVQLELTDGMKRWSGTSFIYSVETNAGTAHFLVTNKHVLAGASTALFRLHRGEANKPVLGTAIEMRVDAFNDAVWAGHPTSEVDVAVLPFSSVLAAAMSQQLGTPFFRSVGPDLALTSTQAASLDAIEEVTFIGYPSGIYDTRNLLPVLPKGTTATPIVVDYEGLPAFLIDASVFPGSSGSPVFIFNRGMYTTRDNTPPTSRAGCY